MRGATLDHPCAAPDCGVLVGRDLLMCVMHWRMVPMAIRHEVYRAWRAWRADMLNLDKLNGYKNVRSAAITSVTP